MKTTGFSFKKSKSGDLIATPGRKIKPHRVELITRYMKSSATSAMQNLFNFNLENYETSLNLKQLNEEIKLFEQLKAR